MFGSHNDTTAGHGPGMLNIPHWVRQSHTMKNCPTQNDPDALLKNSSEGAARDVIHFLRACTLSKGQLSTHMVYETSPLPAPNGWKRKCLVCVGGHGTFALQEPSLLGWNACNLCSVSALLLLSWAFLDAVLEDLLGWGSELWKAIGGMSVNAALPVESLGSREHLLPGSWDKWKGRQAYVCLKALVAGEALMERGVSHSCPTCANSNWSSSRKMTRICLPFQWGRAHLSSSRPWVSMKRYWV